MAYRTGPLEGTTQVRGPLSPKPHARAFFFFYLKGGRRVYFSLLKYEDYTSLAKTDNVSSSNLDSSYHCNG